MPASPEQVAANRRNASKSTGPKTPEGKARSRFNALTHGMTAKSVVLPGEDEAHVTKRFVNLHAELRPSGESSAIFVDDAAFLSIRLERCRRWDTAALATRVRSAEERFDDARKARVEELDESLDHRSSTATRRLQAMPEGVDRLLEHWDVLRSELDHPDGPKWGYNHLARTRYLRGIVGSTLRDGREYTLTEVMGGFFANMDPRDAEGLETDDAKKEFARLELLKIYDAEIARLKDERTKLDHDRIAEERAESVDLALFDDSKEATLARKYEAATRRGLYRAFREFREAEAAIAATTDDAPSPESEATSGELGSVDQINDDESDPDGPGAKPEPGSVETDPTGPEIGPIAAEIAPEGPVEMVEPGGWRAA